MMDTSALTTYRMLCDQYQSNRRRNEQIRRDSERLKAIFKPVSTDKLETLKKQYIHQLQQDHLEGINSHPTICPKSYSVPITNTTGSMKQTSSMPSTLPSSTIKLHVSLDDTNSHTSSSNSSSHVQMEYEKLPNQSSLLLQSPSPPPSQSPSPHPNTMYPLVEELSGSKRETFVKEEVKSPPSVNDHDETHSTTSQTSTLDPQSHFTVNVGTHSAPSELPPHLDRGLSLIPLLSSPDTNIAINNSNIQLEDKILLTESSPLKLEDGISNDKEKETSDDERGIINEEREKEKSVLEAGREVPIQLESSDKKEKSEYPEISVLSLTAGRLQSNPSPTTTFEKNVGEDVKEAQNGFDFWDTPICIQPTTTPELDIKLSQVNEQSSLPQDDKESTSSSQSSVDYSSPKNLSTVITTLLQTINAHIRKEHKLAKQLYANPSVSDNIKKQIQQSTVLNSLLTKHAEWGKDLSSWDINTLGSVLLRVLSDVVTVQGPPMLEAAEGSEWSLMWPLILEHVRLLFQCGESLEKICDIFHVVLKVDKMKLLNVLQEECGIKDNDLFSASPSMLSSLSSIDEEGQRDHIATATDEAAAYRSLTQSLLQSSQHSDLSDSLSEDSAIVALQSVGHTPLQHKEEVEISENEGDDDSLPLPDSPPPLPQRIRNIGTVDEATLRRRMGFTEEDNNNDDVISSHLSMPPSDNSDDDFDFFQ